ncbi:hypothetical protein [Paenibacillus aquistagni]|uniref:hypothetical protein n=1 Tax=Paenibacillus aquistagni TaxID=1852522 RepID=UPI00145B54FC|nr:hypothetical protein [Paenibacillus aquistagni]NMM54432.1 hypothetical protein [Paenibacillus aquistagni]
MTAKRGFQLISWGILFFIDFSPFGFDILPDIVGFLLIYRGAFLLADTSIHFANVKKWIPILLVLSIYDLIAPILAAALEPSVVAWSSLISSIITTGFNVWLVWQLCKGLSAWAEKKGEFDLVLQARKRAIAFIIMMIVMLLMLGVALISPYWFTMLVIPVLIAYVTVTLMLLYLFNRASAKAL